MLNFKEFSKFNWMMKTKAKDSKKFLGYLNMDIAQDFKYEAIAITPVRTGMMQGSWAIEKWGEGDNHYLELWDYMFYSSFVDLGTRKMAPRRITARAIQKVDRPDSEVMIKVNKKINDNLQFK